MHYQDNLNAFAIRSGYAWHDNKGGTLMSRIPVVSLMGILSLGLTTAASAQPSPPLASPPLAEGGKPITLRATRSTVTVEGFGQVDLAYFYDETFVPEPGGGGRESARELLPPVWHLEPGEALRVTLQNKLDPRGGDCQQFRTNLHTHGLLVAPWTMAQSPFGKLGDYIFPDIFPEATPGCASTAGAHPSGHVAAGGTSAEYQILLPKAHPSGLFWYHPHPHMLSERQVGGGMAGLIAVGSLWDYAYLHCSLAGPANRCASPADREQEQQARRHVQERFLLLKDMQVKPHDAPNPGNVQWQYNESPDPGLCGADPGQLAGRRGSCTAQGAPGPWLFPVNGQLHPQIDVSDAGQVWRIGNTSPNVTYRLAVMEGGDPLCMQVLSRDGVAVSQGETAQGAVQSGNGLDRAAADRRFESEIILMPGSRVELFISYADALNLPPDVRLTTHGTTCGHQGQAPAGAVSAEFVTLGFDTGSNPPGTQSPVGDPWPAIELAGVTLQPPPSRPAGEEAVRMRVAQGSAGAPDGSTVAAVASPMVATLRERLASDLLQQRSRASASGASPNAAARPTSVKAKCGVEAAETDDPHDARADAGQVRVVWFAVDQQGARVPDTAPDRDPQRAAQALQNVPSPDGTFDLATEIRDAAGQRVWPAGPVELRTFDAARTDVCVHAGHREIWRLVNLSDETHNFHIHQSKFRVLTVHDPFDQLRREAPWALTPDQVHDVFPVPKFGYVDVEVGFGTGSAQDVAGGIAYEAGQVPAGVPRPVQVGRFVFHCHILEHEDGGMMAVIEVLPAPAQSTAKK